MTINKEWHLNNKMPKNASFEQRVKWHQEHNKNCSCRPGFPKKLIEEANKNSAEFLGCQKSKIFVRKKERS